MNIKIKENNLCNDKLFTFNIMTTNKIIAHIIGLDEVSKSVLISKLNPNIKIIDLDKSQQKIHNSPSITKLKQLWKEKNLQILSNKNQLKIVTDADELLNIDSKIKMLMSERQEIKISIYRDWKKQMNSNIKLEIKEYENNPDNLILVVGFNIYPKDYRVRIPIQMQKIPINNQSLHNKIIFDINPKIFASNQIQYYLQTFSKKIINGTFPLTMLDVQYLICKYKKFTDYYLKQNYQFMSQSSILDCLKNLESNLKTLKEIPPDTNVWIAMLHEAGPIIPFDVKKPIKGFYTKKEAISYIKTIGKKCDFIFLYQVPISQFALVNNTLLANSVLRPVQVNMELLS